MALLPTQLAEDTLKEVAATAAATTVATATIATATAAATKTSTATIIAAARLVGVGVGGVPPSPATTLGGHISGRLRPAAVNLLALLKGDELGIQLIDGDRFHARGHGGHDGLKVLAKAGEDEGDKFLVL